MDKTWIEKKKNNNIKNMWQGLLPFRILVNSVYVCVCLSIQDAHDYVEDDDDDDDDDVDDAGAMDGAPNLEAHWNCATQTQSLKEEEDEEEEVCKCVFCLRRKSVYSSAKTREFLKVTGTDSQQTVVYGAMSSRRLDEWLEMYTWRICWDGMALQGFLPGWVLRMFGQQQGATSLFVRLDSFLFLVIFVDSHTHSHTRIHSQIRYTCVCVFV